MSTVAELIEETLDIVYTSFRRTLTTLDGAATDSDTTVTFTSVDDVSPGSEVAIDDEILYVADVNATTRAVTVIRGQRATTAVAHDDGAVADINPRFPRYRVRRALGQEIRSWPSDVFRVDSLDLDTGSGTSGYDLVGADGFLDVLDVQIGPRPGFTDAAVVRTGWYLVRGADPATFPSGAGVVLTGLVPTEARDLRVTLALPFDTSDLDDDVDAEADMGLAPSMLDIPPMGAAARLLLGRESKRLFGEGQPEARRAEEVPVGANTGNAREMRRETMRRLGEEATRLRALYPIRRS